MPKRASTIPVAAIVDVRPEFTKSDVRDEVVADIVKDERNQFEGQRVEKVGGATGIRHGSAKESVFALKFTSFVTT